MMMVMVMVMVYGDGDGDGDGDDDDDDDYDDIFGGVVAVFLVMAIGLTLLLWSVVISLIF